MRVLGVGMSRTGTVSLKHALKILGFDTLHTDENMNRHLTFFDGIYFGNIKHPDFAAEYQEEDAIVGSPTWLFYKEFVSAFPEAKAILTIRDNEDQWFESISKYLEVVWKDTFPAVLMSSWCREIHRVMQRMYVIAFGSPYPKTEFLFKKVYREHIEKVKSTVPAERLLVFNVKQGWEPLCKFLGKEIPVEPFPFKNYAGNPVGGSDFLECKKKCKKLFYTLTMTLVIVGISILIK